MRKWRKNVVIAAALASFMLTACGSGGLSDTNASLGNKSSSDATEEASNDTNDGSHQTALDLYKNGVKTYKYSKGSFKKYDTPVSLSVDTNVDRNSDAVVAMAEAGEPVENGRWIQYFSNDLNINWTFDWTEAKAADYTQKLTLAMASGELADVFWVPDQTMIKQLADAGTILDLTDIYQDNVNETLGNVFESEGTSVYGSGIYDGKLYALPVKMPSTNSYNHCWVRRDWLKECNLEEPKTMDDVEKIAKTFKEHYTNAVGMMFDKDFAYEMEGVFWAFGGQQNNKRTQWVKKDDGTIAYAEVQDTMKGGLKWLNKMYTEGLLPEDSISMSFQDALSNYVGTNRCGLFYGPHWYGFYLQNMESSMDDTADWVEVGIPSEDGSDVKIPAANTNDGWYCVNSKCENPDAVIQTLNAYVEKLFGENNDFANYFACDKPAVNSGEWGVSPIHVLSATVDLEPYRIMKENYNYETNEMNEAGLYPPGSTYWDYIKNGLSAYKYMFGPVDSCFVYVDKTYPQNLVWNEYIFSPSDTYNERWSSMLEILDSYEIKMITGELDVDKGFEEMVQKWNDAGGTTVTTEFNETYKEFQ